MSVRPARGILRGKIHRMVAVWPAATQASSSLPDEQRLCGVQEVTSWADARLCRPRAAGPDRSAAHPAPVHRLGQRRSDHRATAARVPPRPGLPAIRTAQRRDPEVGEDAGQLAKAQAIYEPGRIERTLRGLGVTGADLLRRAEDLDRAAKQLITKAAAEHGARPSDPSTDVTRAQAGETRIARDEALRRHKKLRPSPDYFATPVKPRCNPRDHEEHEPRAHDR